MCGVGPMLRICVVIKTNGEINKLRSRTHSFSREDERNVALLESLTLGLKSVNSRTTKYSMNIKIKNGWRAKSHLKAYTMDDIKDDFEKYLELIS